MRAFAKELLVQSIILILLVGTIMPGFSLISPNRFFYPILGTAVNLTSQTASSIPFMPLDLSGIFVEDNSTGRSPPLTPADVTPSPGPAIPATVPALTPTPAPEPSARATPMP